MWLNPQQGQLLEGKEGKRKGSPGTCPISPGGATALVFTQEHTWESMECGRSPKQCVILFWSNLLYGSEQTPSPLWCSDSQMSNAGLGLSAFAAPMLPIVALLPPWAGAWLRHDKQCT